MDYLISVMGPMLEGAGVTLSIFAITLVEDKASRKRFANGDALALQCRDVCFKNNLIMRATHDSMIAAPPLVMTRKHVDEFVDLARRCVDEFQHQLSKS